MFRHVVRASRRVLRKSSRNRTIRIHVRSRRRFSGGAAGRKERIVIMGAAGRDFHNFLTFFKNNSAVEVVAFTATQIPGISGRVFPASLAGPGYEKGIPIEHEDNLEKIIKEKSVDKVVFAYSDIAHEDVMHLASRALATGADFELMGNAKTQLKSSKPVIAVVACRTGAGKSQVSRYLYGRLKEMGKKVISIRHPMPYGDDLALQKCQRFASYEDLDKHKTTIEEREEYEPYVDMGGVIYAGVDYAEILGEAEKEAEIVIWDGGNNDCAFVKPTVQICVVDPLRAGDESRYHPGEVNVRNSDIILINKIDSASFEETQKLRENCWKLNPNALMIAECASPIHPHGEEKLKGKDLKKLKALVIDDGPTCTHGDMPYGSGYILARKMGISQENIIDPRVHAVGTIKDTFKQYPHVDLVLPAMGYSDEQLKDLETSINSSDADVVISGTPINLDRVISVDKPVVHATYKLKELDTNLAETLLAVIGEKF